MEKKEKAVKERRRVTTIEAYSTIVVMMLLICIGSVALGLDLKMMIILSIAYNMFMCVRCHIRWMDIEEAIGNQIKTMATFLLVILGIGFLIVGCMVSGMIPLLIAWLSQLINPNIIVLCCFLFNAILAFCIGSSFATIGTIGVVMISVATLQNANLGMAAAACICGAAFGQYISPIADFPNLSASMSKISTIDYIKLYAPYVGIAFILTAAFYIFAGQTSSAGIDLSSDLEPIVNAVFSNFKPSVLVFLPLVVALVLSIMKLHSVLVIYIAGFVGIILGVVWQGFSIADCLNASYSGFDSAVFLAGADLPDILMNLLNRGGILSMADSMIFIYLILTCAALFEVMGTFEVLKRTAFRKAEKAFPLTLTTMGFGTIFGLVTCEPYVTVIVTSDIARGPFKEAGYDPKKISIIANASANFAGYLAPWSFLALYLASSLGVTPLDYIPYATFFYLVPILILIFSLIGFGNKKLVAKDAATEATSGVSQ